MFVSLMKIDVMSKCKQTRIVYKMFQSTGVVLQMHQEFLAHII